MKPPACIFCGLPTELQNYHANYSYDENDQLTATREEETFDCKKCRASMYHENASLIKYSFRYKRFSLVFWTDSPSKYPRPDYSFLMSKMNDMQPEHVDDYVVAFDFLPNLTPQNIAKKLPTILTFL